jgi:hypothetical protein
VHNKRKGNTTKGADPRAKEQAKETKKEDEVLGLRMIFIPSKKYGCNYRIMDG